jgi:hypothetical protein
MSALTYFMSTYVCASFVRTLQYITFSCSLLRVHHLLLSYQDVQRRNNNSPGTVTAEILTRKRIRNPPVEVEAQPSTKNKTKKIQRKELDGDSEEDVIDHPQSQGTVTTSTGLQKSSSTSSRGSDNGSAMKAAHAASSQRKGHGYTPPMPSPSVSVSSAEKVNSAKGGSQNKVYDSPAMHGITPDPPNVLDGPENQRKTC